MEAVDGRVKVYFDGGQGTDVLKALALGAKAVFIGRPVLWGLAYQVSVLAIETDQIVVYVCVCVSSFVHTNFGLSLNLNCMSHHPKPFLVSIRKAFLMHLGMGLGDKTKKLLQEHTPNFNC